jgi:hypothetical protein
MLTCYSEVARSARAAASGRRIAVDKHNNGLLSGGRLSFFRGPAPWRGLLWTAVNRGQVERAWGCVSSHPQPPQMGAKRSPMGVVAGARRSFRSSSQQIPMSNDFAARRLRHRSRFPSQRLPHEPVSDGRTATAAV